jgi:LysR family transcriptional regulator, transcriptional activator for bauABCD operon
MQKLRQLHDIDLKLLRSFCCIVEEGSFTAAQAALNLSQSALSEYLKSLEIRLGTRLCQRGPKGFKLYPQGEVVYKAARELFASVEAFKQRAADLGDGHGYELSIAIQDGIVENPQARIPEAIERFTDYYPSVSLKIEIMLGSKLMGRAADGLVDVGVGLFHDQFRKLTFEPLFDEQLVLCCGRAHPLFSVPDADLTQERLDEAAYCHRGHLEYFHPDTSDAFPRRGDIGHGAHAHLALILSGRNVGYLPDHVAEPFRSAGRLRLLRPDRTRRTIAVVAVTGRVATEFKLSRCFMDCLVDCQMEAQIAPRTAQPVSPRDERVLTFRRR